jgi:hypothetical protein
MSKEFVGYANITETHKFFFTAQSQEDANGLIAMVEKGDLSLDDLHKGDSKVVYIMVEIDLPEEVK